MTTIFKSLSILWLAFLAAGCVNNQKRPQTKEDSVTPSGDDGGNTDAGGGDADPSDDGQNDDFVDDDPSDGGDEDPLAALLADCGATDLTGRDPSDIVYETQIKTIPKGFVASLITVRIEADIAVTPHQSTQDASVFIDADGGLIDAILSTFEDSQNGKTIADNVPFADYANLSQHAAWEGVLCTFVPATRIVNERGGRTVATFDPPIPSAISPKAIASRYAEEIGEGHVFADIKATIVESDHAALAETEEVTGKVTVEKVEPTLEVEDAAGEVVTITADLAYKLTYDFGSPDVATALGLSPAMTYFISHDRRDLVANTLHSQKALLGDFTFVHND